MALLTPKQIVKLAGYRNLQAERSVELFRKGYTLDEVCRIFSARSGTKRLKMFEQIAACVKRDSDAEESERSKQ